MKNPYSTDQLIQYLKLFWAKAEGLDYGHEHEVMHCAALRLQELSAHCLRLERKVRNQRLSLRENREIVEMRRKWLGSDTARRLYVSLRKRYNALRDANGQSGSTAKEEKS